MFVEALYRVYNFALDYSGILDFDFLDVDNLFVGRGNGSATREQKLVYHFIFRFKCFPIY